MTRIKTRIIDLGAIALLAWLSGCAEQPRVAQKLDDRTMVTITHSATPVILSPNQGFVDIAQRDFVQLGVIEINRMGARTYFLWLGISIADNIGGTGKPADFESVVLDIGGEQHALEILSWTHEPMGTSEAIYKKLFGTSVDAYYEISVDQVRLLTDPATIRLLTTGNTAGEFVPWYTQTTAKESLAEFLKAVPR